MPDPVSSGSGAPTGMHFFVLAWAGLAGAAGVALAAMAAHKVDSPALATAATMLTLHAAAAVGLVAMARQLGHWPCAAVVMLAASSLFSGEIAFHTLSGNASLQMLAPIGGTLMIGSWLAVAAFAVRDWLRAR